MRFEDGRVFLKEEIYEHRTVLCQGRCTQAFGGLRK